MNRFPRVIGVRLGYDPEQVDELILRIERTLGRGHLDGPPVTADEIRRAKFGVKLGGYNETAVDFALDAFIVAVETRDLPAADLPSGEDRADLDAVRQAGEEHGEPALSEEPGAEAETTLSPEREVGSSRFGGAGQDAEFTFGIRPGSREGAGPEMRDEAGVGTRGGAGPDARDDDRVGSRKAGVGRTGEAKEHGGEHAESRDSTGAPAKGGASSGAHAESRDRSGAQAKGGASGAQAGREVLVGAGPEDEWEAAATRVEQMAFRPGRLGLGYREQDVDALLDRVVATLRRTTDRPVTAEQIRTATFTTVVFRPGYAIGEVDRFLAELAGVLERRG
ncbi:hypothetical protein Psi02_22310 [Planotetraspora silvatica]|uniref:DivIVA domain-containing protein n=1 Tax=Planotetraspora silvatica TaxID=234614 RepID=A0A8J3UL82_9ACTN|nr:DivIVA domain-containing protein [Planotetraspora silvatica]GII45807.1 hypothetical protein Psi02_22310 [Planotetraspora silvatica]